MKEIVRKEFDLNIGAQVFCTDVKCGRLAKYAVNTDAWLVARLIVEDGMLLKRGRVFPFFAVEGAAADEIQLSIDMEELPNYPEYREEVVEKPAPGGAEGAPLREAGSYGHAAVAPLPTVREKVRYGIPEELAVLERGTPIYGLEGRIGKVDHFLVDAANGEITRLVAQQGLLFSTKRLLPIAMVERISEKAISIAATEEALQDLPHYEPHGGAVRKMAQTGEKEMESMDDKAEMDRATLVSMALLKDDRTCEAVVEVIDERGVITLQGEVDDVETREAAEVIAAKQPGVISIVNALRVKV